LLKRIDFHETQRQTGIVKIKKLVDVAKEVGIPNIDLLCMDVQGFELNILKGCEDFLKKVRYVIMEEPKPIVSREFLPPGVHSKYIGCPTSLEISDFMKSNGFVQIERIEENKIEDNVMYKNLHFEE
jgi:hypothetical protein